MQIHAIQTGTVSVKHNQLVGKGHGPMRLVNTLLGKQWTEIPIYAYVIEHPEGVILVDTGDTARTSEAGYFPRWHPYYRLAVRFNISPEEELGAQLKTRGIDPTKDVRTVILTHMHTDHVGGLYYFPNSTVLVHSDAYSQAQGFAGKLAGYVPNHLPVWFKPTFINFETIPAGAFPKRAAVTTAKDVVIVPTPGHAPGHVSVLAALDDVYVLLAGDVSYNQALLLAQQPDGVGGDAQAAISTMQTVIDFAKREPLVYLPAHDPDAQRRLKARAVLQ